MRRIIAAAAVLILMLTFSAPVYAEGVKVLSDKGDRISVFDDVTIDKDVNGNVITVLGDVETNADINGLVVVVFGDVKINSTVAGQIITVFGNTKLGKNAIIRGSLFSMGVLDKDPGAKVMGQEVNIFGREMKLDMSEVLIVRVVLLLMFSIIVLLVGILYIAASKKKISGIEATIESNLGRKLLLGFLAYLGATIIFALLFITIIIPVLYFALIVLAAVISSICLGKLIMKAMNPVNSLYLEFITGLVTITLLELLLTLLIPGEDAFLGLVLLGAFGLLINSFGVGTLFIEKFGKK